MSGIELAGLVLGAFPVLLHALEGYRMAAEEMTEWWRIQRTYKKCHQDLKYYQILFEDNVERFLLPLVVDDDESRTLLADPAGKGWEDKELETRLQQRLPKSYALFLDIIRDVQGLMESLKQELGVSNSKFQAHINPDGKLSTSNATRRNLLSMDNMEFQVKRTKFTVRKSARERLFTQLCESIERMRKLLESSDQITIARQRGQAARPSSLTNRKLNEFWRHAKRLHEALSSAWQCKCDGHVVDLGLEHRTSENVEFNVLFHSEKHLQQPSWQRTKIKMVPNPGAFSVSVPQTTTQPVSGRVRWSTTTVQKTSFAIDQTVMIKDLCSALAANCPDCIGFLEADEYRFMLYPGGRIASIRSPLTMSLNEILCNAQPLTRRRRYFLSLTLASSYLQLGATPWLNTRLRKENVVFLQDPNEPQSMLLDFPYIRQEMSRTSSPSAIDVISSLGIRLLELCFGVAIEATEFRKQLPVGDEILAPIFDYTAAIQWSRLVSEEAGPEFAAAIEWCLHAKALCDNNWRKELWQHVIVPLDACHKQVSQKPALI